MTLIVEEMFKNTCRTCLSKNGEMLDIFSDNFYVNQIPKKLMAFTKVEISDHDLLPKVICKKCIFLADSFYCFKEQCEAADDRLKLFVQTLDGHDSSQLETISDYNRIGGLNSAEKNSAERSEISEEDYLVEYISEDVKEEVENAVKKRRETERKISLEKVSDTVRNLRGIEVVPIGNSKDIGKGRCRGEKKEEIVVFSIERERKRCKTVKTLVKDNPPPLNKRLRLLPETSVVRIDGERNVTGEDSLDSGKYQKLNFSTVRKIVKIDDKELCVQPKQEIVNKYSHSDDESMKNDADNDSVVENLDYHTQELIARNSVTRTDRQRAGTNHDLTWRNEDESHRRDNHYPSAGNSVEISAKEEVDEIEKFEDVDRYRGCDMVTESMVCGIISGIDDFDNADDCDGKSMFGDLRESPVSDRSDKNNEFFIDNKVVKEGVENIEITKVEGENLERKLDLDTTENCGNERQNSEDFSSPGDQVTPLALLSVNSSGEKNRRINWKIYKRNDPEGVEGTTEDGSLRDLSPVSVCREKSGDTNMKFYQCTICSKYFESMPEVLRHNVEEHMAEESPHFCLICNKSFEDKSSVLLHVEEHKGSKPYECTFCPKRFTRKRNLKRHVNHHIDYKPYQCHLCAKKFTQKSSLECHAHLHTEDSPFECKTCSVSFSSKTNWRKHLVNIHEKVTVVTCQFCNKELPDKRALRVHTRVHTGDRPYGCPHCDKRFTQQCNLNTHIHCHLNDRPFVCPHCGKGFNQRGTRDDHILTHTGEKPHKCTECEAGFTVASALKRHMWIHTDKDRPHNCEKCKLRFVGFYDLRRHLKLRHGEIVKPDNPRVERLVMDNRIDEGEGKDRLCETGFHSVEAGPPDSDRSTAKENDSLSCNVDKVEESQIEKIEQTKVEYCEKLPKEEFVNETDIMAGKSNSTVNMSEP